MATMDFAIYTPILLWRRCYHKKTNSRSAGSNFFAPAQCSVAMSLQKDFDYGRRCIVSFCMRKVGSLIPACERQVCLADVSVRVL